MKDLTMSINSDTSAIDLYDFIKENMSFENVIKLYRLLNNKITMLYDEPRTEVSCSCYKEEDGE